MIENWVCGHLRTSARTATHTNAHATHMQRTRNAHTTHTSAHSKAHSRTCNAQQGTQTHSKAHKSPNAHDSVCLAVLLVSLAHSGKQGTSNNEPCSAIKLNYQSYLKFIKIIYYILFILSKTGNSIDLFKIWILNRR